MILLLTSNSWGAPAAPYEPVSCSCTAEQSARSCGVTPAFMSRNEKEIDRELGFDVPGDNVNLAGTVKGYALYLAFASFLEKSDRSRMFYPEFITRAAQNASVLTLKSNYVPKNVTEMDEYFRCSIPNEKYCLYKNSLRHFIGLAAKASGFDYAFLACQSYVESRFNRDAKSNVGAVGYSQIKPGNISYLNEVLHRSIQKSSNRIIATIAGPRTARISRIQDDIARIWEVFWAGTKKTPRNLCKDDLTCHRQVFLAQVLSLKVDLLAMFTSTSGMKTDFDAAGNFRIEGMDKGDSQLLLAGSYNLGVTKMIRLISQFCNESTKLKDCLDKMSSGSDEDIASVTRYIMRIRDCSQQFSAEKLDFDDSEKWTAAVRTEKQNQQRDETVKCLLHPCPYQSAREPAQAK